MHHGENNMPDKCDKCKATVLRAIVREINNGNIEFAKQLQRDALEYLKERNMEFQWLENIEGIE